MEKRFYVYILAKAYNSTLYVGVTSDLPKRIWEHREGLANGFTKKYGIKTLVYFEAFDDAENAIRREKRLKRWSRAWKIKTIESVNPGWRDLYDEIA